MNIKRIVLTLAATAMLGFATAGAQVIVDFNNNTLGQLAGQNGNLSSGLSGNWNGVSTNSVVADDLTHLYALPQSGTAQKLVGTSTSSTAARTYVNLATPLSGTVYFSFLAQVLDSNDRLGISLSQGSSSDSSASGHNIILIGTPSGATLQYRQNTTSGGQYSISNVHGNTLLILGRIDFNFSGPNERVQLWVDPDLSSGNLPDTPNISSTDFNIGTSISTIGAFIYGSGSGDQGYLDNIRFGTSLGAVVVPEPSHLLLSMMVGFTVLLAGIRRCARRKK